MEVKPYPAPDLELGQLPHQYGARCYPHFALGDGSTLEADLVLFNQPTISDVLNVFARQVSSTGSFRVSMVFGASLDVNCPIPFDGVISHFSFKYTFG